MGLKDGKDVQNLFIERLNRPRNHESNFLFSIFQQLIVMWARSTLFVLATVAHLSTAEQVGHWDDSSVCADPDGFAKCYDKADDSYTSCITNNCAGGSTSCVKSCNGDRDCIAKQCPNLGIDCINVCECIRSRDQIDCTASSCWNQVRSRTNNITWSGQLTIVSSQVYSCEYQVLAEDLLNNCIKQHLEDIPFWPPPDNAPGGCSCNFGKADKQELQISNYIETCANNMTNLNQMSDVDDMTNYSQACMCCSQSAVLST